MADYLLGLDLGQAADPSALIVLERSEALRRSQYAARLIRRWPLGTSYVDIVADVWALVDTPPLTACRLVVDATGVGRPVLDLLRDTGGKRKVRIVPVVITAGGKESLADDGYWHVSKLILIATVQVLLQQRRLAFARNLPETVTLVKELANYRVKVTDHGNETFSAREGAHDDLVLALALGCWAGERLPRGDSMPPYIIASGGYRQVIAGDERG